METVKIDSKLEKLEFKDRETLVNNDITQIKSKNHSYISFYFTIHKFNCKICTLDYIENNITEDRIEELVKIINLVLNTRNRLAFNICIKSIENVELLSKYFPLLYCIQTPFGYNNDYHYNAMFLNKNYNNKYNQRIKKEGINIIKLANGENL